MNDFYKNKRKELNGNLDYYISCNNHIEAENVIYEIGALNISEEIDKQIIKTIFENLKMTHYVNE